MDGEVRIPIRFEVNEDELSNELSELRPKLEKLKSSMDEIFKNRSEDIKLIDTAKLAIAERQLVKIRDRLQNITDAEKQDASVQSMMERNIQVYNEFARELDKIIDKYPALREAMSEVSKISNMPSNFTATTNSKELLQYIDRLQERIQTVRNMLSEAPEGNKVLDESKSRIQENITALQSLIAKIGECQKELAQAEMTARSETSAISEMRKAGASKEEIEAQRQVAKAARDANYEMEKSYAESTASIKQQIKERMSAILDEEKEFKEVAKRIADTNSLIDKGKISGEKGKFRNKYDSPKPQEEEEYLKTLNEIADAEKRVASTTHRTVVAENEEAAATKNSAAQFYYKLRAVKMLGFVVNQAHAAMTNFVKKAISVTSRAVNAYLRLIPGIHAVRKALDKTSVSQKKFNKELKSTTLSHENFNKSLKTAITNLLKYGFGIRSLFVLFNKLRRAISDGFGQMSLMFDDVNQNMSSIITSINQIKAAITGMVEPLLSVIAPILEKISALVSDIAYKVASFIAALTGQSAVYKATRKQIDYAKSLDKTAKSAKEAKKELSGLDKLNVINSEKDTGNDKEDAGAMGWEKVPIDAKMADWAKKFKDFLDRLLGPIKKAWEKMKGFVKSAWQYMCNELLKLGKDFARDFWRVWEEYATQKIFEDIFKILGDIFWIIGNIAKGVREAWNHNENGYRILAAIRDIIGIIVAGVRRIADYMVIWSEKLTFVPLFDAIADVLQQQVVPAVQKIVDLFVYLTKTVLLELVRYIIEELAPVLIKAAGNVVEAIGNIAENILKALDRVNRGKKIVAQFEKLVSIVADKILEASEYTKEWSKTLDFNPFFEAVLNFLNKIEPLVQFLVDTVSSFWTNVLLPFWKYLIEDGGPKLLDLLGKIFGEKYTDENGVVWGIDFEHLKSVIDELMPAIEKFLELSWETFLNIIEDIGKAFDNFVNSGTLDTLVQKFKDWVENADPEKLAEKIEKFAISFGKAYASLTLISKVILPVVQGIMTIMNVLNTTSAISKFTKAVDTLAGGAGSGGFAGLLGSIGPIIPIILAVVAAIGVMIAAFGGVEETLKEIKERFDDVVKKISEFAEKIGFQDTIDNLKAAFDNLKGSLTGLRPLFEFLLDVLAGVATVIGKTVLGAIDGIVLAFTGVIDIISGVADIISGFVALLTGDHLTAMNKFEEGVGKIFLGLGELIAGVINGIAEALAGFIDEVLPGVAEGVGKFVDDVKNFFAWLREQLIGDPIVYDIQDGIENSFTEWITNTATAVGGWVKDRVNDFVDLANGIGEEAKKMKDKVVEKFTELKENAGTKADELKQTAEEKFSKVRERIQDNLATDKFTQFGKNAIKGVENGIKQFSAVMSAASTNVNNLKSKFREGLSTATFRSLGSNLINALANGLRSGLSSALSAVSSVCNQITSKVRSAFEIHSPSRVFMNIGELLMKGLVVGVDDGSEEVEDAFSDMVPSDEVLDSFYTSFIDMVSNLTRNSTAMFDEMFLHIEESMQNLEKLMAMSNMYQSLDNIPQMKLPDIVNGYTLPSNKEFKQKAQEFDVSKLPDIIKDAVIDAITSTIDLRDNDETVIVNIDGKEVFQAVRNKNSEYKKQHGVSAFE